MVFGELFERFVAQSPAVVIHRALMERIFAPAKLDAIFHQAAEAQYERELLFSTLVDLTGQVVCRISKSVHAAFVRKRERISVSIRALYDKLSHVEPCTSRALLRYTADEVREIVDRVNGWCKPLLKGYRVRILDGNHLAKTDHRLGVLRGTAAGALPGQTLVVLDPQYMTIDDIICCEDGHAQERSLVDQIDVRRGDLFIDDRNFCTLRFLFLLLSRKASFITRQHARMPWTPLGKPRYIGSCSTGRVYEQMIEIRDPETGKTTNIRRITLKLKTPTRDGDMEIHLLTNLPAKVAALKIADLYRKRWTLEHAFNELTLHLRCELNTLGYPKAALFAFAVAACSYNLLAAMKGALRGVHGEQVLATKVSNFFITDEISGTYRGMMIALPPENWVVFQTMSLAAFAAQIRRWAGATDLNNYPKHPRSPKKPKRKLPNAQFQHVSTAKLLDEQRLRKQRKRKNSNRAGP
jgi:DDE family transposase